MELQWWSDGPYSGPIGWAAHGGEKLSKNRRPQPSKALQAAKI